MTTAKRRWGFSAAVLAAVLAVLLTACSGGGQSAGDVKPAGTPFKIGYICYCSTAGPTGALNSDNAFNGWVKWVNANGGINGHPVELIVRQDPGNPGVALSMVKALVGEGIVALVAQDGSNDAAWASYIETVGIPVFQTTFGSVELSTGPNTFSTNVAPQHSPSQIVAAAVKAGAHRMAVLYCGELPSCKQAVPGLKQMGQPFGIDVVFDTSILLSAPTYTAQCLAARDADADSIFVAADGNTALRVVSSCAQQGYQPRLVSAGESFTQGFAGKPGTEGMIAAVPNVPFFDTSIPAAQTMRAAFDKYVPNLTTSPDFNDIAVAQWTTGMLIAEGAKKGNVGGANPLTGAALLDGIYSIGSTTLEGMTPPMTFTKGQPNLKKCWFFAAIKDGKFTLPDGLTPGCAA